MTTERDDQDRIDPRSAAPRGADRSAGGRRRQPSSTTAPGGSGCTSQPSDREVRVPPGVTRLRRRELERHRDRLDLRRSRHLQEVQGADRRRLGAGVSGSTQRSFTNEQLGLGWRLACLAQATTDLVVDVPPLDDPTQGSDRRRRPAGDPAAGDPEAVRRADRADPVRPADRPGPAARRDRRPRAARRHPRAAPPSDGRAAVRLQGHGGDRGRRADRRRAWGHDCEPVRDRVRPRHHDRRRHPARHVDRHARRCGVDAQQAAAVRRRRDHPHQRHHARPRRARPAARARRRDAQRAGRRRVQRGRRRPGEGLRDRGGRQRHDGRARARHRSRAARRRAVHHVDRDPARDCSPRDLGVAVHPRAPRRS